MSKFSDLDRQIQEQSNGRPFSKCTCGASIPQSFGQCLECARLKAIGFGPPAPKNFPSDTDPAYSYPSDDHKGYSDNIPTTKFPKGKERV